MAVLAVTVAHWGWIWFGPAPLPLPPTPSDGDPAQRIADARLFGTPAAAGVATAPSANNGDLRLMGVFAESDGRGYALFRAGARGAILVASGQQIGSGVSVEAVRPDGVTLLDGGTRRELTLRGQTTADKSGAGSAVASASAKSTPCTPPANFTGPVIRLNAELLGGLASAPDNWKALVSAGPGALVVRDQSGFAQMLGLKNGDRIERANGIALAIPDDIASTVLQPLTKNQQVLVVGTRDGKPQQWLLVNGGACAG
jgi:hypothetical protein